MTPNTQYLDRHAPLLGASHADVMSYGIDTPMRYTELYAVLAGGRKVRLEEPRQLVGWQRRGAARQFLLRTGGGLLEIVADGADELSLRRWSHDEWQCTPASGDSERNPPWRWLQTFIGRDGSLVFLRRQAVELRQPCPELLAPVTGLALHAQRLDA